MDTSTKTILRWAGSKRLLVSELSRYWSASNAIRYVEPFAGSACLFFNLKPKQALIADLNKDLIDTYKQLKKSWEPVYEKLISYKGTKSNYYNLRSLNPEEIENPITRAARFIYLNRYCFNGLYRTNQHGKFNVPYGEGGKIPDRSTFLNASKVLRNAKLMSCDFETTLEFVQRGDFVYMDPPYSVENARVFTEYDKSKFDLNKLKRLRGWLSVLNKRKIPFLVSYLASDEAKYLSRGFNTHNESVRRSIAGFTTHRRKTHEVLISNIGVK